MGLTIQRLLDWHPARLGNVADDLVRRRKTLTDLQDEVDAAQPPVTWRHSAGDNARTTHESLRLRLLDMVAEVSDVTVSLDAAEQAIKAAKDDLEGWLGTARGNGFRVDHGTGTVTAPPQESDAEPVSPSVDEVAAGISAALTAADQADADLAGALRSAARGTTDGGTGTLDAAALQLPPVLDGKSPAELAAYLNGHPDLLDIPGLPDALAQQAGLTPTAGLEDGTTFSDDPAAARDSLGRLSIAALIAQHAQENGGTISADTAQYLRNFYDEADGSILENTDRLDELFPADDDLGELLTGDPDYVADATWMQQALSNGALLLTDDTLDGSLDYLGADQHAGDGDSHGLPDELYTALHDPPQYSYSPPIDGGAGPTNSASHFFESPAFNDAVDFLGGSTASGGEDFSRDLIDLNGNLAGDVNSFRTASDAHQDYVQYADDAAGRLDVLNGIAGRNPDAVADAFHDAVTGEGDAADDLRNLYQVDYPDGGHGIASFSDAAVEETAAHPDSRDTQQFQADVINFLTDTEGGHFEDLVKGGVEADGTTTSITQLNGEVGTSLADLVGVTAHEFGTSEGIPDTSVTDGDGLDVGGDDAQRLFTLIHLDEDAGAHLSENLGAWQQSALTQAVGSGDPASLHAAGDESSMLDALNTSSTQLAHGIVNDGEYLSAQDAYEQNLQHANAGKDAAGYLLGKVPIVGSELSSLSGYLADGIIQGNLDAPEPGPEHGGTFDDGNRDRLAYDYARAQLAAGGDGAATGFEDGHRRGDLDGWNGHGFDPYGTMSAEDRGQFQTYYLGDESYDVYREAYTWSERHNNLWHDPDNTDAFYGSE